MPYLDEEERRRRAQEVANRSWIDKQIAALSGQQAPPGSPGAGWMSKGDMGEGGKPTPDMQVGGDREGAFGADAQGAYDDSSAFGAASKSSMKAASPFDERVPTGNKRNWWEPEEDEYDPSTWF